MKNTRFIPVVLLVATLLIVVAFVTITAPVYSKHKLDRRINKLLGVVEDLQQEYVTHAQLHGYFPDQRTLDLENEHRLYDISAWSSDKANVMNSNGQVAVIQASLNGKELALKPGDGGQVTCLMALRSSTVESKCFYQIKKM